MTRRAVLEYAEDLGLGVAKRMLALDDVLGGEEAFLTNSSWGILPITNLEASVIGDGKVGEICRKLRQRWIDELT